MMWHWIVCKAQQRAAVPDSFSIRVADVGFFGSRFLSDTIATTTRAKPELFCAIQKQTKLSNLTSPSETVCSENIRRFTARKLTNAGTSEPHGSYQTMSEKNWCRFFEILANAKSPTFV
jgi:hypothetical protein